MPQPVRLKARIVERIEHAPGVHTLILRTERPVPRFRPGQFLHLAIDPYDPSRHWPESRIFSIASPPERREELRITFSAVGRFTRRMLGLCVGDPVWVKLPYGDFVVETASDRPAILVAGGTGITPFVALLEAEKPPAGPLTVLYGARRPELLIYLDVLERAARRCALIRWAAFVEEGSCERAAPGRPSVEAALEAARAWGSPASAIYYLSGPPAMLNDFREGLGRAGVAAGQIRFDAWE
jgi:ferredoxin-NADP reductase